MVGFSALFCKIVFRNFFLSGHLRINVKVAKETSRSNTIRSAMLHFMVG
jgi:hypothetical protein